MYLSVIVPAYNEAKTIGTTLRAVGTWLSQQKFAGEIIVVDNRSSDQTAEVVHELARQFSFIRLIRESRGGKGYAVQSGMLFAGGQVRLFMDADNSTSIEHFDKFQPYLQQGYDVVIGSLAMAGAQVLEGGQEPFWRVVLGKLGNLWIQILAVPGVWDTQRGFKVFSEAATKAIFPRLTILGWGFDVEVLAVARARGYRIKEVPVTWKNNPDSRVTIWTYPKVLGDTVKVFFKRLVGKYK